MKTHLHKLLFLAGILALLDQISKYLIVKYLDSPFPILGKFFTLRYSENPHIAFSIPLPHLFIMISSILLIGFLFYAALKEFDLKTRLAQISLALILGGAIGNLIDRFSRGFVVDFISIWQWPIFNLADIYITTGVLLILVFYGRIKHVKQK